MIKINLLPRELRKEEKKTNVNLNDYLIYPIGLLIFVIVLNIIFGGVLFYKKSQLSSKKKQWDKFYPQYQPVENLKIGYNKAQEKDKFLDSIMGKKINWSKKLNILSDQLPEGVWFRKVNVSESNVISIDGTVVSLAEDEVSILNKFRSNLKTNNEFFKDFRDIELKYLLKRTIGSLEVIDFTFIFYPKA